MSKELSLYAREVVNNLGGIWERDVEEKPREDVYLKAVVSRLYKTLPEGWSKSLIIGDGKFLSTIYTKREFIFRGKKDGDMEDQFIHYFFPVYTDLNTELEKIKKYKKNFINDAFQLVLNRINDRKEKGDKDYFIKPEWLSTKNIKFNKSTRELYIVIGLKESILKLKDEMEEESSGN